MSNSPSVDPNQSRSEALARIDVVERALEQLAASVRTSTTALQQELAEVRLSVIELHGQAVSNAAALTEAPLDGDVPAGSAEGARLVALDLIGRGVDLGEAKERLGAAFPGVDAERVLSDVGATIGQ